MSFCASETRVWVLQVRSCLQSCFQHLERRCVLSAHMLKLRFLLCVFKRSCQTWVSELRVVFGFCVMFVCFHFVFWVFGWCVGWESFDHVFLTQTASFHHCTFEKDISIQNEGFFFGYCRSSLFFHSKTFLWLKKRLFSGLPSASLLVLAVLAANTAFPAFIYPTFICVELLQKEQNFIHE